jgi:DivIVA domain-containing protein
VPAASHAGLRQQQPESESDPEVDRAELIEWVQARKFSTTRLRPGYDQEEVDAFLIEIRDSFRGVLEPSLTSGEIRVKQFSTTRLRRGYDEEEVEAFLDEAESRLAAQVAQSGEQPQDKLAGQPQIGELELDAHSLAIQNRPATSQAYLTATACLVGSLVSVGLAAAEIAEYARHNRVDNLAILGLVIGGLAGSAALVNDNDKRLGWAHRISTVAVWLGFIGFFSLLFLYGGQRGWGDGG